MIAFDPTDDQKLMQESVASFAKTLRARLRETEKERAVAPDLRKTAHELGLGMVAVPEALGGAGLGLLTAALLEEELAYGDPAAPFGLGGPGALGLAATELGTPEQAKALLSPFAGADGWDRFGAVAWGERKASTQRAGLTTVATHRLGTWELTGEKAYVVNADRASSFVVFAQTSEGQGWKGTGAFVVTKGTPGLTVLPRETSLGLDAASFGGLKLDGVEVDESDRLAGGSDFDAALVRFFAKHAVLVAARAVGLARAAFDIARDYCEERRAFGKPIGHFQAVAFTLADRAMDVDASRGLVWRAAHAWDEGASAALAAARSTPGAAPEKDALLYTARAASFALEAAMRCADDAVQLHGGAGFMRDYPVEKLMRDAKQLQVCTMTAEHCDQLAAAIELGRAYDPGDVLPTAESQSAFV
jgi:alkylation response protein AidB-like acyl-CoA dehydrogenase